ncbi:MAG: hypothetical protein GY768_07520, partial [Planctomycetaceae bacterium]|nr:hypothetical protein [Planctomycetaceae bacterium]
MTRQLFCDQVPEYWRAYDCNTVSNASTTATLAERFWTTTFYVGVIGHYGEIPPEGLWLQPVRKTKDIAGVEVPLTLPKGMSLRGNDDSQEAKPPHAASEMWRESVRWVLKEGYHERTSGYVRQCPLGKGPGTKKQESALGG